MTFVEALLRKGVKFRQGGTDRAKTLLNCPFCPENGKGRDTQLRLCVHARQGWGRCMHCGWKARWAVARVLKQLGLVADGVFLGQPETEGPEQPPVTFQLPADFQPLTHAYDDLDQQARQYILKRGVTRQQIRANKIGVSYTGRYAYRIIFPIYEGDTLRGLNARDFTGLQQPKYLLSPGEKPLYNFDPSAETVILSEGVIKALRIAQAAPQCSSASLLGHSLTEPQLQQLQNSACQHVIIYPDAEHVGRQGAVDIAQQLQEHWRRSVSVVLGVTQPADDAKLEAIQERLTSGAKLFNRTIKNQLLRGR